MVDFDSDTRVFFADRQDNDEIIEDSYELQSAARTATASSSTGPSVTTPTNARQIARADVLGLPFPCDLLVASTIRGVTDTDRAECFNDRMRALNVQNQFVATPQMTAAQIGAMWNQVVALGPNYRGVTPAVFTNAMAGPSTDLLNIAYDETEAVFADLSWDITEKLTLGFGMRTQTDTHLGTDQIRQEQAVWRPRPTYWSRSPGITRTTTCATRSAIRPSTPRSRARPVRQDAGSAVGAIPVHGRRDGLCHARRRLPARRHDDRAREHPRTQRGGCGDRRAAARYL